MTPPFSDQEAAMALGLYFRPTGFTRAIYDEAVKELDKAGAARILRSMLSKVEQ